MADEPINNKARLEYEAGIREETFTNAEARTEQSSKKVIDANRAVTREAEREARNRVRAEEKADSDEIAALKQWQREQDRIRKESANVAKSLNAEESRDYKNKIDRERAQDQEAARIRLAMRKDEKKQIEAQRTLEAQLAADRKRWANEERTARGQGIYTPAQMRKFRSEADKLLEMLPGGAGAGGGGGNGRRPGQAGGINPFLTSFGFGLSSAGNVPGGRLLGSAAIGQGFGGIEGLYGAIAGGAVGGGIVGIIASVKQSMEDTRAEQKFYGALLQVGAGYERSRASAEAFQSTLRTTRAESYGIGAAFAGAGTRIQTRAGDEQAIANQALATGQTADEIAKAIDAISRGNREVFEAQTGLKATITVNEYAKSIGKLPSELTKAQEAQALYNKFIKQGNDLQTIANANLKTAAQRWTDLKNTVIEGASAYGEAWLDVFDSFSRSGSSILGYETFEEFEARKRKETDDRMGAFNAPGVIAQAKEQERQRLLEQRYEAAAKSSEIGLRGLSKEKLGETQAERLEGLIAFRKEFESLSAGLDQADPRLKSVTDDIEGRFSQAVGKAYNEVEQLKTGLRGMTGELAVLQLQGQANPFVKLYSDAADAADRAYDRFRVLGAGVVQQYTEMQQAAINAQIFQVKVGQEMKATSLEFEAARLSKPFIELTGEMKRSLSILQSEVGAAINVPKLLTAATAIDIYSRFQTPRNNAQAFGGRGYSEIGGEQVLQKQYDRLTRLRREYGGGSGIGGAEASHLIDQEFIKLFQSMPPQLQAQALRGQGRGEYGRVFAGAFRNEAAYSEGQVELAIQRAAVGRSAVQEAQARLRRLGELGGKTGGERNVLRAEMLAITGALPREELTGDLLKGRIEALKEEAVFQRQAQEAAIKAVAEAQNLRKMLDAKLAELQDSIKARNESVLIRVLDDSSQARVSMLGPGIGLQTGAPQGQ